MTDRRGRGPTLVWAILVVATLVGFNGAGMRSAAGLGFVLVMLVAAFKARLVVRHFMHLRAAPLPWRIAFDALIAAATLSIVGLHLAAMAA